MATDNITGKRGVRISPGEARRLGEQREAAARLRARQIEDAKRWSFDPSDPLNPTKEEIQYHDYQSSRVQHVSYHLLVSDVGPRPYPKQERIDLVDTPEAEEEARLWKEKARRALAIPEEWIEDVAVYPDSVVYLITPIRDAGRWPTWADDLTEAEGQEHLKPHERVRLIDIVGRTVKKIFFRMPPYNWRPTIPMDYPENLR